MPRPQLPTHDAIEALLDCSTRHELQRALRRAAGAQLGAADLELWERSDEPDAPWTQVGPASGAADRPREASIRAALDDPRAPLPSGWMVLRAGSLAVVAAAWAPEGLREPVEALLLLAESLQPTLTEELERPPPVRPSELRGPAHGACVRDLLRPEIALPVPLEALLTSLPLPAPNELLAPLLGRFAAVDLDGSTAVELSLRAATGPALDPRLLAVLRTVDPEASIEPAGPHGPVLRLRVGSCTGPG